jgi:hypothetical protein
MKDPIRKPAQAKAIAHDLKKDKIFKAGLALLGGLMAAALFSSSAHAHTKTPRALHSHGEDDLKSMPDLMLHKFSH